MRFYRPLGQISALTFDLDDTLYDNRPVIDRTMHESLAFVRNYHPSLSQFDAHELNQLRQTLLASEPEIYHDVTVWRHRALELGMRNAGLSAEAAKAGADAAMENFAHWRSRVDVPQETHDTLAKLAQKWPLVAITNGNARPELFGLSDYFRFVLRAGPDGRSKPFADMYHLAAARLNLPLGHILHVGDDLTTDVAGSLRCGMQACWIKPQGADHPSLSQFDAHELNQLRQTLLAAEPEIYHDVTVWRHRALELGMRNAGLSAEAAKAGADAAMEHFAHWRSRVDVPQETHDTLAKLAEKWPLVAITNGNARPELFGLSDYFRFVLRAGPDGRSKPFADMYHLAAERLNVPLGQILHVGDDLTTDVAGAIRCGMQACWIKPQGADLMHTADSRLLPHIEISRLASLTSLI